MQTNRGYTLRYLFVVAVFCAVCVIYLGRLFFIQIAGRENSYDSGGSERTVTVQAVRGEIYDRNGVKLVENHYTYDMTLSHAHFFSMTPAEKNEVCLQILEALRSCRATELYEQRFFPFEGSSYPYYLYSEETLDTESTRAYRLKRVLSDLALDADTTARELMQYYVEKYDLLRTDGDGMRLYDDDQIDSLIRMYYDMDALRFRSSGEYVLISGLSFAGSENPNLMAYVNEKNIGAVDFLGKIQRVYCYPGYASHILGTVGPIYSEEWEYYNELGYEMSAIVGKDGCEAAFEAYLRGTDGKIKITEDANGNVVTQVLTEPVAGSDVYLTIDINLQIAAEDGLCENVQYVTDRATSAETGSGCNAGAAVAMDPDTFEVLAIASYPTYDLTTYNNDYGALISNPAKPLLNRAIDGAYAPGSTIKPGMAAIGLLEEAILSSTHISCTGKYKGTVGCSTFGDNHSGAIDAVDAIAYSCNSFFCELGHRLGIRTMEDYLSHFGFGEKTGFELGGTSGILAGPTYRGEIQSEEQWMPGMTWQAAIGQSDHQASPLQLAAYISTLTNGGSRYTAHLLHSVYRFGEAEPYYVFSQSEDTLLDRVELSKESQRTVFEGMKKVVNSSNVIKRWINSDTVPVQVGGKTGTAQTGGDCDNALFVCAAPYDDPEIVISVVLEKGYTGGYASLTAGRVLEEYYDEE
ncbi:MAG: hypothetical protein IJX13_02335 [Clostridia bacterium]|nr:hypothetical protein [Clostridia bacterium]